MTTDLRREDGVTVCVYCERPPRYRTRCNCRGWQDAHRRTEPDPLTYSTVEVAELTGATFRQIDYWTRAGLTHPVEHADGPGTRRRFPWNEVEVMAVVVDHPTQSTQRNRDIGMIFDQARDALHGSPSDRSGPSRITSVAVSVDRNHLELVLRERLRRIMRWRTATA